jgi:hypothetical protein
LEKTLDNFITLPAFVYPGSLTGHPWKSDREN